VAISYVQIYCERILDLLNPETPHASLMVRDDAERGGVYLDGAATIAVSSVDDCMKLIAQGNMNRTVASTGMNTHSSRSHAILIARIERKESPPLSTSSAPPPPHVVKLSSLYLVDLAGSERVKKAKVYGRHVNELKAINLSLSALGNCVAALSKQQPQRHVPYRDSKLTRLLSSSLGGNAKTSLIITVSPSPTEVPETLSTLQFGQRAMRVVVQAHQNVLSVLDYKSLYEETQQRLDECRASNHQLHDDMSAKESTRRAMEDQLMKAQLRIQHLEFECQAAKMQSKNAPSVTTTPRSGDDEHDSSPNRLEEQIAFLVKQRDQDVANIQRKCDLQVETYKRLAEEAQQEWHELEDALAREKQQVLTSLRELKDFKARFFELEDSSTDRIAELVADESDKERERKYEKELQQQRLMTHEKTATELQQKVSLLIT
jgi:kinesin family member 5